MSRAAAGYSGSWVADQLPRHTSADAILVSSWSLHRVDPSADQHRFHSGLATNGQTW
jgi:hypothetical protein